MPYIGIYRSVNFVRFEQVTTSASIAQTNSGGCAYVYIVRIENYRLVKTGTSNSSKNQ